MNHLSTITPFLEQTASQLPLDVIYKQTQDFENAYDQMVIKGKMVDDTIQHNMSEKGTVSNVKTHKYNFFLDFNFASFFLFFFHFFGFFWLFEDWQHDESTQSRGRVWNGSRVPTRAKQAGADWAE